MGRLRPVVTTALVHPRLGADGADDRDRPEVRKPLATVVIGALISATLLPQVVLSVLAVRFGRPAHSPEKSTA